MGKVDDAVATMVANLEASGSFNAMVSHRVRLDSIKGADEELIAWLKQAYNQA